VAVIAACGVNGELAEAVAADAVGTDGTAAAEADGDKQKAAATPAMVGAAAADAPCGSRIRDSFL
jgi:hypothetical protein